MMDTFEAEIDSGYFFLKDDEYLSFNYFAK